MRTRRAATTAAVLLAVLTVGTSPAAASPPDQFGPFEIDQDLLDGVPATIEQDCGVDVTDISGTGTIRFTHFYADTDGDPLRGQGWFHLTIDVTTATGSTTTIRERSMDKYAGADLVYDSTSGRATVELGTIGHLSADGTLAGRTYDVCAALQ
jgi:hypothetical protein